MGFCLSEVSHLASMISETSILLYSQFFTSPESNQMLGKKILWARNMEMKEISWQLSQDPLLLDLGKQCVKLQVFLEGTGYSQVLEVTLVWSWIHPAACSLTHRGFTFALIPSLRVQIQLVWGFSLFWKPLEQGEKWLGDRAEKAAHCWRSRFRE